MNYKIEMGLIFKDTRALTKEKGEILFTATGKDGERISEEHNTILTTKSEALINLLKFLEAEDVEKITIEYKKRIQHVS